MCSLRVIFSKFRNCLPFALDHAYKTPSDSELASLPRSKKTSNPQQPASSKIRVLYKTLLVALLAILAGSFTRLLPAALKARTPITSTARKMSTVSLKVHKSADRGHAHHGWLKTYHHFSFANYFDPSMQSFGALRVINEDRVDPGEGFGTHPHREFEIFSYVVDGEIKHRDSLGSVEVMKRGDIQMTSTGTGVTHSEFNARDDKELHFLQIWAKPNKSGLKPNYFGRHFSDEEKTNKIVRVVAPPEDEGVVEEREGSGPIPVHSDIRVSASILTPSSKVEHSSTARTTKTLVHNIMRTGYRKPKDAPLEGGAKLKVNYDDQTVELDEGDSVFITGKLDQQLRFESTGPKNAEFLLFEML